MAAEKSSAEGTASAKMLYAMAWMEEFLALDKTLTMNWSFWTLLVMSDVTSTSAAPSKENYCCRVGIQCSSLIPWETYSPIVVPFQSVAEVVHDFVRSLERQPVQSPVTIWVIIKVHVSGWSSAIAL